MFRLACLLIGYFFGCIQNAYLVGRFFGKIDIREHGSKNAGSTNISRTLGFKYGLIVFVLDILKAVVAFYICYSLFDASAIQSLTAGLYAGLGTVLGHNFPVQLQFKGGKGFASTIGIMICFNPKLAVCVLVIGFLIVFFSKYISVASMTMTTLFSIMVILLNYFGYQDYNLEMIIILILLTTLSLYQHRGNIKRLVEGNERKFSIKKT